MFRRTIKCPSKILSANVFYTENLTSFFALLEMSVDNDDCGKETRILVGKRLLCVANLGF